MDVFWIDNLPEYIFRLVYILILAYLLAGTFLHAAQKSDEKVEEKTWGSAFLGFTKSTIVIGSVVLLFIAFVIIQFQYFFGGRVNIGLEGYTYSEYAVKGFGELVMVAFFSLLLLLGLGAITRRESENQRRLFSGLGVGTRRTGHCNVGRSLSAPRIVRSRLWIFTFAHLYPCVYDLAWIAFSRCCHA